MPIFTFWFIAFLLTDTLIRCWIAVRQVRHVGRHRDRVPPQFEGRIGLRSHQRAADYTKAKAQLTLAESVCGSVLLIALTLFGGLQWLNVRLAQAIDHDIMRELALIGAVVAIVALVGLPFTAWRKFRLEAHFGFNRVTPRLFVIDLLKGATLTIAFGLPLAAAVLWVMGNTGHGWGWWAWLIWVGFNFLLLWLFPTVIAPVFNTFTPLQDVEVKERIQALAKRCGFALSGLFVMDGSKRSAHGNAYFTGFGKSRRIVFFDTLLSKLNVDEIEAVLAHELGHFKHKHIVKRMLVNFALALVFFQLLAWLSQQPWFYTGLGVFPLLGRSNDGMAIILFFLVVPLFTFWAAPLLSWFSRRDEFQADRYAAQQSSADALVSALVKLYDDNAATLTPDPVHSAFYDSHPPAVQRIQQLEHEH